MNVSGRWNYPFKIHKVSHRFALVLCIVQQMHLWQKNLMVSLGSWAGLEFKGSPHLPQTCCQYNSLITVKGETWSLCMCYHFHICSKPNPGLHTQQKNRSPSSHCCLCSPVLPFSSSLPLLSLGKSPLILSPYSCLHSSNLSVPVASFPHWPPLHHWSWIVTSWLETWCCSEMNSRLQWTACQVIFSGFPSTQVFTTSLFSLGAFQ